MTDHDIALLGELTWQGHFDIAADLLLDLGLDLEADWMRQDGMMPPLAYCFVGMAAGITGCKGIGFGTAATEWPVQPPGWESARGNFEGGGGYGNGYGSGEGEGSGRGYSFGGGGCRGMYRVGTGHGDGSGDGEVY